MHSKFVLNVNDVLDDIAPLLVGNVCCQQTFGIVHFQVGRKIYCNINIMFLFIILRLCNEIIY